MNIKKQPEQEIQYDEEGEAYAVWNKKIRIYMSEFHKEAARFLDRKRVYWHGLDCTRDVVCHISDCGTYCVLGKVRE